MRLKIYRLELVHTIEVVLHDQDLIGEIMSRVIGHTTYATPVGFYPAFCWSDDVFIPQQHC